MSWEQLSPHLWEWFHLAVRWFHVVAGITWIGQTYLFHWMEQNLEPPKGEDGDQNIAGKLWMVHGGGFWFKYEALLTWISGVMLLTIVYYFGGVMQASDSALPPWASSLIGVGVLIAGFAVYDLACKTPLAKTNWCLAW